MLEIISALLNTFLILNEWVDRSWTNNNALKLCSVTAIGLVWFKAFYWMRLFKEHAFFMNLLKNTLLDIVSFLLMLAILIGCATNMIYVIIKVDHDDSLIEEDRMPAIFREFFSESDFYFADLINSFLNTYLLALGEFDFEDFNTRGPFSQALLWILFLFFTFMLQITFVNMVIAIMSQTFDNVADASYQSSITERISLLNDFSIFLDFFKLDIDAQFLFLVYPSSKDFVINSVEEKLD